MRFEPINKSHFPLLREECMDNLVCDFGVKSYHWQVQYMSELERVLVFGGGSRRETDFYRCHRFDYINVFDHEVVFKCKSGMPFVLTMPYAIHDMFHERFDAMMSDYYDTKERYRNAKRLRSQSWIRQLESTERIKAVIVDDRYKIRENGDFAAVIATTDTLKAMGLA